MANKEFTEAQIPLCGGNYYFKRCPASTLKIYDERLTDALKELDSLESEAEVLNNKQKSLESQIENIDKIVELLDKKEDPSDKELDKAINALNRQEKLFDELKKVREDIKKFNEEHEDNYKEHNDKLTQIMADKVEAMLDGITAEFFIENYDAVDMKIVFNLSKYYEMCILGNKESKIKRTIKEDLTPSADNDRFRRR